MRQFVDSLDESVDAAGIRECVAVDERHQSPPADFDPGIVGLGKADVLLERNDAPNAELVEQLKICSGHRVPVMLFLNEDFDFLSLAGDRTLSRYRALAARKLGPSCPLPGAPVPPDEIAATLQDWINEFERVHLMVRLSAKLRERHND